MKKILIYLNLCIPFLCLGNVADLRAILEEDLAVHIKINQLKKEQKELALELELAMQNTRALISSYEAKTKENLEKNKEQNFKAKLLLDKISSTEKNLISLEKNIEKIYQAFLSSLDKVPQSLREKYSKQIAKIEAKAYANSKEKNLACLDFLSQVLADAKGYNIVGDCLVFGLNTEFSKQNAKGDIAKLFEIIENNSAYEILRLEIEKGSK